MKILLLTQRHHKSGSVSLAPWQVFSMLFLAFSVASITTSWVGYSLGHSGGVDQEKQRSRAALISSATLKTSINQQREAWEQSKIRTNEHLNALALKLGQLQSQVVRLNALGERLTKMGKLDSREFDFKKNPGRGGIDSRGANSLISMSELVGEIETLSRVIEDREVKLNVLEELIMNYDLQKEIQPSGRPVKGGYISSKYGERHDPFTGKKSFHHGVDIAGRRGTVIKAVGSGVVIFSGVKNGYGNVVKVQHGNGFVTIYGHNHENLVQAGDYVSKGQQVATVGSTGRSTGPHVHFEVQLNGKAVNPVKYLSASK